MAKKQRNKRIKVDDVRPGDRVELHGMPATVVGLERPDDGMVHIWWRSQYDAPDVPPHRMARRSRDETLPTVGGDTDA